MSKLIEMLTQEYLKEILHYDPETGIFTWKARPLNMFQDLRICNSWNARCVGRKAGWIDNGGYSRIRILGKNRSSHRLAFLYMTGEYPPEQIDHINHVRDDNRWTNLRPATQEQNQANANKRSDNTSGFKGVHWSEADKVWIARIGKNGKRYCLGKFDTPEEAHLAYCKVADDINGKFANHG